MSVDGNWPVKVGNKIFFLSVTDNRVTHVGARISGQPVDLAPKLTPLKKGRLAFEIKARDAWAQTIEHDLRGWQAMMCAYANVDIDFDDVEILYEGENDKERDAIDVPRFTTKKSAAEQHWNDEFTTFGRAFLMIDEGKPLITTMSFYRESQHHLFAGRFIDSYNAAYLFLETLYCRGRTGNLPASKELARHQIVVEAFKRCAEESRRYARPPHIPACTEAGPIDLDGLIRQTVELRGKLRHHNKNDPNAWSPINQEPFEHDARFLVGVAYDIAFSVGSKRLWEDRVAAEFRKMAEEQGNVIRVLVTLSIKESDTIRDQTVRITVPGSRPTPKLAMLALENALAICNDKAPGAPIYAIRAIVENTKQELFRYDLAASLPR